MTDIVARLRSLNDGNRWPMMDEAADEIERLRTRLAIQFGMHSGGDLAKATQAEIARLRERVAELQASSGYEASIAEVQIEKLRNDYSILKRDYDALRADNERLRAALEAYACPGLGKCREPKLDDGSCLIEASGGRCGDEARRALEQKP